MKQSVSPAERLTNLVIALTNTPTPMTKADVRRRVYGYDPMADPATFERMFERDKDVLRELGIPLRTVTGPREDEVGYRIEANREDGTAIEFTPAELGVLGIASRVWRSTAGAARADRGVTKVTALAPQSQDQTVQVGLDLSLPPAGAAVQVLMDAIAERREVAFDYVAASTGLRTSRRISPWRLTAKGKGWYVCGLDHAREERRVFRLSRIVSDVRHVSEPGAFEPPSSAQLTEEERAPVRRAILAITPGEARDIREQSQDLDGVLGVPLPREPEGQHRDLVAFAFTDVDRAASQIASTGASVLVLEPSDLRDRVIRRLRGSLGDPERAVKHG